MLKATKSIFQVYAQQKREKRVAQLLSGNGKMITDIKEKIEVLIPTLAQSFPRRQYNPTGKCEVQAEKTGLQLETDKQSMNTLLL